ncbi:hypothetical protein AVEN_203924-1 [Araneus ventricosus]|uniref:G-protein coupled receptors family 1 profile domain-containing protein n=1 Tax=Araneus ventricosus TaxID=182803 RepID=A0A4Y2JTX0_ARAVE|nr:hypothetical protein AVEN_203924-1 [Araneus ventricosus]
MGPDLLHAKSYVVAKRPTVGVAWKFGEGVPAQASSSSSDCGSKLRGPCGQGLVSSQVLSPLQTLWCLCPSTLFETVPEQGTIVIHQTVTLVEECSIKFHLQPNENLNKMASEDILPFNSPPHLNSSISDHQWQTTFINATTNSDINFDHAEAHHRYISRGGQIFMTGVYIFGAVANIFSLLLLSQGKQARNKKLTLMIRCLAANDLMALGSSFFLVYMRIYLDPSFVASRWFCGLRVLTRFFGFSSGSVASVMAVERFIALTRPFFYQKLFFGLRLNCARTRYDQAMLHKTRGDLYASHISHNSKSFSFVIYLLQSGRTCGAPVGDSHQIRKKVLAFVVGIVMCLGSSYFHSDEGMYFLGGVGHDRQWPLCLILDSHVDAVTIVLLTTP